MAGDRRQTAEGSNSEKRVNHESAGNTKKGRFWALRADGNTLSRAEALRRREQQGRALALGRANGKLNKDRQDEQDGF